MTRRADRDRTRDRRRAQRAGKALVALGRAERAVDSPASVPAGAPGTVVDDSRVAAVPASQPSGRCARCGETFTSTILLVAHTCTPKESTEASEFRLRCHRCGRSFIETAKLIAHKCPGRTPPEAAA